MKKKHFVVSLTSLAVLLPGLFSFSAPDAQAQTESVLYSFSGGKHGDLPAGGLVEDAKGKLYGTTVDGGILADCGGYGCGVVFDVTSMSTERVLHRFAGGSDGANPASTLVRDAQGNLYGTTQFGGSGNLCQTGCGTVFEVTPSGVVTVLHNFTGLADGGTPAAGLIQDGKGNLYGTTTIGGTFGWGAVFKIAVGGSETVLYSFTGGADGANPSAPVILDTEGNLYGTTAGRPSGNGNVFKLTPGGIETVLYSFTGGSDGANPYAGLVQDPSGNLYGTTAYGGNTSLCNRLGCGVVFEITATGTYMVLHWFGQGTDGVLPIAGLVLDAAGNLYGTTHRGGTLDAGTVFEVAPNGTEKVLYSFTAGADGGFPSDGVLRDAKGNLYGTTFAGGALGKGAVFKVVP